MINLLEQLNDKDKKPLAKKSEELGIPQPTNVPLAQGVASTDKSAQMAASPQAKTSAQQKSLRSEQVASQAPRAVAGSESSIDKAQKIIDNLAAVNQEAVNQAQTQGIEGVGQLGAISSSPEFIEKLKTGEIVYNEEGVPVDKAGNPVLVEDFSGLQDTAALEVTVGELDPEVLTQIQDVMGPSFDPNMSLEDLKSYVNQEIDNLTVLVDDARETISDPNQPANVRQEARQLMRDYGAAHLIATDAELDEFEKDIKNVGLLEIGGETYTLEQLDNPAIAASLLDAAEQVMRNDTLTAEDLNLPPMLFNFVKKHANAIESTLDQNRENLSDAKEAVDANTQFTESLGPELTKALGLNPYTMDNISESKPGLKALSDFNTLTAETGMSSDEVKETLEFISKRSPERFNQWLNSGSSAELKKLYNIHAIEKSPSLAAIGTNLGLDFKQIGNLVADAAQNPDKYSDEIKAQLQAFDANGNGSIDTVQNVKNSLVDLALRGERIDLGNVKTVEQRQKAFINDLIPKIADPTTLIGRGRRKAKSQVSNALKQLDKIKNKEHPMVKQAYRQLRDMWSQLQGVQVKDNVRYTDPGARPQLSRVGTTWIRTDKPNVEAKQKEEPKYTDTSTFITR